MHSINAGDAFINGTAILTIKALPTSTIFNVLQDFDETNRTGNGTIGHGLNADP